jgi:hypothetical protein
MAVSRKMARWFRKQGQARFSAVTYIDSNRPLSIILFSGENQWTPTSAVKRPRSLNGEYAGVGSPFLAFVE